MISWAKGMVWEEWGGCGAGEDFVLGSRWLGVPRYVPRVRRWGLPLLAATIGTLA